MSKVLVSSKKMTNQRIYHEPDPDNPNLPKCKQKKQGSFRSVELDKLVYYRKCKDCAGNVERSHTGRKLSSVLLEMDP